MTMSNQVLIQTYISSLYGYSPLSIKTHVCILTQGPNCFLSYTGNNDLINTTIRDVENYKSFLLQRTSPGTTQKHLSCLRKFFKYLRVQGYVKSNPALEIELPITKVSQEYKVVCPEVVEKLLVEDFGLNNFSSVRNRLVICLIVRCGLHSHEVCKLMLSDLVGSNRIRVTGRKNRFKIIELDRYTSDVLKDYLNERQEYMSWRGSTAENLICAGVPREGSFILTPLGMALIIKRAAKLLHTKYGLNTKDLTVMALAHTSRFFNWIVAESETDAPEFDGSMGHALRHKITEYMPAFVPTFKDIAFGI